jgi:hypothetical protein
MAGQFRPSASKLDCRCAGRRLQRGTFDLPTRAGTVAEALVRVASMLGSQVWLMRIIRLGATAQMVLGAPTLLSQAAPDSILRELLELELSSRLPAGAPAVQLSPDSYHLQFDTATTLNGLRTVRAMHRVAGTGHGFIFAFGAVRGEAAVLVREINDLLQLIPGEELRTKGEVIELCAAAVRLVGPGRRGLSRPYLFTHPDDLRRDGIVVPGDSSVMREITAPRVRRRLWNRGWNVDVWMLESRISRQYRCVLQRRDGRWTGTIQTERAIEGLGFFI